MMHTPPSPIELVFRGQDKVVAYACPKCGLLFGSETFGGEERLSLVREMAAAHCHRICRCGSLLPSGRYICPSCWLMDQRARETMKYMTASKVDATEYDRPVYWEGKEGSLGAGFFATVDEVIDFCESEGVELPDFVWGCRSVELCLDVAAVLDRAFEGHEKGARDRLREGAEEELEMVLRAWCERQNVRSWEPDYTCAVLLPKPSAALVG